MSSRQSSRKRPLKDEAQAAAPAGNGRKQKSQGEASNANAANGSAAQLMQKQQQLSQRFAHFCISQKEKHLRKGKYRSEKNSRSIALDKVQKTQMRSFWKVKVFQKLHKKQQKLISDKFTHSLTHKKPKV